MTIGAQRRECRQRFCVRACIGVPSTLGAFGIGAALAVALCAALIARGFAALLSTVDSASTSQLVLVLNILFTLLLGLRLGVIRLLAHWDCLRIENELLQKIDFK
ncbi:hypothetical protein D3C85_1631630 [compost metagenome]